MEFAYIKDLEQSLSAIAYKQLVENGERDKKKDGVDTALTCGTCGGKAWLRHTSGLISYPIFAAHHEPKDCPESSTVPRELDGIICDTRRGTRGTGATIVPNIEDPLRPQPRPRHVRESVDQGAEEGKSNYGRRTNRIPEQRVNNDRHLMPKSVLLALLRDRHCFDESVFTMPTDSGKKADSVGADLIREITELDETDNGQWRYVWGKINNTHIPSKSRAYLNGARQNNAAAQSSVMLETEDNTALLEHFLSTAKDVRCTDVWFIAYGQVGEKRLYPGFNVNVRENWALHVHIKKESRVKEK